MLALERTLVVCCIVESNLGNSGFICSLESNFDCFKDSNILLLVDGHNMVRYE
jgi:hypothetical protein